MARIEKNSRIKGLPPKIQLQMSNDATGSFPTIPRNPSDNRTGKYDVSYNDTKTINFNENVQVNAGFYLQTGSNWYQNESEQLTSMYMTGSVLLTNADESILSFTPGQPLTPFRDTDQPAVDGKSTNNSFYATGSSNIVEGGFDQPLWSKYTTEMIFSYQDSVLKNNFTFQGFLGVNPSDPRGQFTSSLITNFSYDKVRIQHTYSPPINGDYPGLAHGFGNYMMYFSPGSNSWETMGGRIIPLNDPYGAMAEIMYNSGNLGFTPGLCMNFSPLGLATSKNYVTGFDVSTDYSVGVPTIFFTKDMMGSTSSYNILLQYCSNSMIKDNIEYMAAMGQPTNAYAFPYGPQYHATSSITIKMKDYITEPMYVDKIVLQVSGINFRMGSDVEDGFTYGLDISSNGFYPERGLIFPIVKTTFFVLNQRKNQNFTYFDPNTYRFNLRQTGSRNAYTLNTHNATGSYSVSENFLAGEYSKNVKIPAKFYNYEQFLDLLTNNIDSPTFVNTSRDLIAYGNVVSCPMEATGSHTRHIVRPFLYMVLKMAENLNSISTYSDLNDYLFSNKYTNLNHIFNTFNTVNYGLFEEDMYVYWAAISSYFYHNSIGLTANQAARKIVEELISPYSMADVVITQSYNILNALSESCYVYTNKSIQQDGFSAFSFNQDLVVPMECTSPNAISYFETPMADFLQTAMSATNGVAYEQLSNIELNNIYESVSSDTMTFDPFTQRMVSGMLNLFDNPFGTRNSCGFSNISTRDYLNSFTQNNQALSNVQVLLNVIKNADDLQNPLLYEQAYEDLKSKANQARFASTTEKATLVNSLLAPDKLDPMIHITPTSQNYVFGSYIKMFTEENGVTKYSKPNPYLLYPEDELIIGWQQPYCNVLGFNTILSMSVSGTYGGTPNSWSFGDYHTQTNNEISPLINDVIFGADGEIRMTLYGSIMGANKVIQTTNTLNQLLTSNTIHEIIG